MNSTDFEENSLLENYETVAEMMSYFLILLLLLYFITYPFYVFVNKVNRQRDKKMTIFPITNHFYLMMKATYAALLCFCYSIVYVYCICSRNTPEHDRIQFLLNFTTLLMASSFYVLYLGNQIFHVLLVSLAIERFLIYFLPTMEKRIVSLQNYISKKIKFVYVAFFIKDIIYFVAHMIVWLRNVPTRLALWRIIFLIIYFTIQVLLFLSAFLYIPIMISVRKLSHLTSAQVNHPQRYIFWQTVVVVIFKTLSIPVIFYQLMDFREVFQSGFHQLLVEMITIPLLITTSYLGCNKRNVTVLMSSFKLKHFLRVIFGGENAVVQPQQYIVSIHSTL